MTINKVTACREGSEDTKESTIIRKLKTDRQHDISEQIK